MYNGRRSDHRPQDDHHPSTQKRKSDHDHHQFSKKPRTDNRSFKQNSSPHRPNGHHKPPKQDTAPTQQPSGPLPSLPTISPDYEVSVFTHASMHLSDSQTGHSISYDRLEFLGDAYIEIISSRLIWSLYSSHAFSAARMSQIRESLVKNETLSEFSVGYGFDRKLKLNVNAMADNRNTVVKLNGDVFEAYVAAVVLSDPKNGFERAEEWLAELWEPRLQVVSTELPDERSKGELQKKIGAKGVMITYVDERDRVIDKKRGIETYFIGVYVTGWGYERKHLGSGTGQSKKAAGMAAAKDALQNTEAIEELMAKKAQAQEQKDVEEGQHNKVT